MKYNIIISLLFTIIIAGCYTVYQHPNVVHKDENGRVELIEVTYKNNCATCHTEQELEKYNYYVKKDIYIQEETEGEQEVSYNDIAYFYNMPWWYEISFTDEYTPVKYDTGIGIEIFDRGSGRTVVEPIILPGPTVSGSGSTTSNSTNQTKTRENKGNTEQKSDNKQDNSHKSNNTRNNDGSRNNGTGRR